MTFKQFLKPDWRKLMTLILLLFIIIPLFNFLLFLLSGRFSYGFGGFPPIYLYECHWDVDMYVCFQSFGALDDSGFWLTDSFRNSTTIPILTNIIFNLIIWYFASCLIIWIYDKLKKKK
jgi:hypothetical protein